MAQDTLSELLSMFTDALAPLEGLTADPEHAEQLLNALGFELPLGVSDIGLTTLQISDLIKKVAAFRLSIAVEGDLSAGTLSLQAEMVTATLNLLRSIDQFQGGLTGKLAGAGDYLAKTQIDKLLARRLLDLLISYYVQQQFPFAYALLMTAGIFRIEPFEADALLYRPQYIRFTVDYARLNLLLKNPRQLAQDVYGWGTANADLNTILVLLSGLLQTVGMPAKFANLSARVEEKLTGIAPPQGNIPPLPQIRISLFKGLGGNPLDVGLMLYGLRPTSPNGLDAGFALAPFVQGSADLTYALANNLTFKIDTSFNLGSGVVLTIRPNHPISLKTNVIGSGSGTGASGRLGLGLLYHHTDDSPITLLNLAGFGLDIREAGISTGTTICNGGKFGAYIGFDLKGGRFVFSGGQGDGFLNQVLGSGTLAVNFDLSMGLANSGFYFQGSSTPEIQLPTHINLGPLDIQSLYLALQLGDSNQFPIEISASVKVDLGPLKATVERFGLLLKISFPSSGGNAGPVNIQAAFKPPNGIGLSLDAGAVQGGGYLFFNTEKEEYGGALELSLAKIVTVNAIGLITTRMPDGSKGFSLLIIITAEFGTGIQLGFGFTLLGVGGLLGLNRTMNLQTLAEGVRNGALNNIMFPHDVVANAPRIISDLRSFFPPENGKFLIGPMVKLGWGTPTLISLSLGVIIEIPGNIAIIGVLRVALPASEAALIILQVSFIGALEFDKQRVWFFAILYESRVLFFPIEGDMGLLMAFGADANFVLSVGGFHPQFNPPPLPFPSPRRVSFSILSTPVQRIRVDGYFGVTSNTVQFGAHAEIVLGLDSFGIEGHIGFDVLIQFSPFYFIAQISASVSLKAFGVGVFSIRLSFALSGPSGWRARGSGSISLLFFDISADFDISWGESKDTSLPPISVIPLLVAEFSKLENWKADLPANDNLLVSLRKLDSAADTLVLHPVGTLRVSQKAVPLDLNIDKVGNQKPDDAKRFKVEVQAAGLSKTGDAVEQFAIAQYQNMDDATKLSRAAYQPLNGGVQISVSGQQMNSAHAVRRVVRYEQIIIDSNYKRFRRRFTLFASILFNHFMSGAAITKSVLSAQYKSQVQPFKEKVTVTPEGYAVAYQADNKAYASFASEAAASDFMQQAIAEDPNRAETLHVIPQFEVAP